MLYTADGKRKTTLSHGDEVVVYRGNSLEIIRDQIPISFGLTLQFKVNDQKNDKLYIGKHSQDCFVFVCQCLAIFYHLRFETRDFLDLGPLRSSISLVDDFCNPIVIFLVGKKKTKICSGDQVILDIDGNVFLYRPLLELPLKIGFPVNYLHNGKEDLFNSIAPSLIRKVGTPGVAYILALFVADAYGLKVGESKFNPFGPEYLRITLVDKY